MDQENKVSLPEDYTNVFKGIANHEDLRLPEHEDDDISEPDQVAEFDADKKAAGPAAREQRSVDELVKYPERLERLKNEVTSSVKKLSVKCDSPGCSNDAHFFVHHQRPNKTGAGVEIAKHDTDPTYSMGTPVGFSCKEHTEDTVRKFPTFGHLAVLQAMRHRLRTVEHEDASSHPLEAANPGPEQIQLPSSLDSRKASTVLTPIHDYIRKEDLPDGPAHSQININNEEDDFRPLNKEDQDVLATAYAHKLRSRFTPDLLNKEQRVLKAQTIREKISNRIKISQSTKYGQSTRDLMTNEAGEPNTVLWKRGPLKGQPVFSKSRLKEVFADPSKPEESLSQGNTAQSDQKGFVWVTGAGNNAVNAALGRTVRGIKNLAGIKPESGTYITSGPHKGAYKLSDYDKYSSSFPASYEILNPDTYEVTEHTGPRIMQPVFESPKWRRTSAAGSEQLRANDPAEILQEQRDRDRNKDPRGVSTKSSRSSKAMQIDEESDDDSSTRKQAMGEFDSTRPAKHEIEGNAQNDWDVRFFQGDTVLVNKNNRVVYADFVHHEDKHGNIDHSQGYWLATGQRVRHDTLPRYVAPEDILGKAPKISDLIAQAESHTHDVDEIDHTNCVDAYDGSYGREGHAKGKENEENCAKFRFAKEFQNIDHSSCIKKYRSTLGEPEEEQEGHDEGEENDKNCPFTLYAKLRAAYSAIAGAPGATRASGILSFNKRSDVNPAFSHIDLPPARLRDARDTTIKSHRNCYMKFLTSNGNEGHDNTPEDTQTCDVLSEIKNRRKGKRR